jgi:hypothetical protein
VSRRRQRGFAMLGALLIAVLAALFAALALAAALVTTQVAAADGSQQRALAAARAGIDEATALVLWRVAPPSGTLQASVPSQSGAATEVPVHVETHSGAEYGHPDILDPVVRMTDSVTVGRAQASATSVVTFEPDAFPLGVAVAEDLEAQAELRVVGSGVYVGGCVRGRALISLEGWPDVPPVIDASGTPSPPDLVHDVLWPVAAVRAGGAIFDAPEANDTDTNVRSTDVAAVVTLPDGGWLAAARVRAIDPGPALADGVLHLDALPVTFPTGEPGTAAAAGRVAPAEGYLVVVDARGVDGGLTVTGRRDVFAVPVTVVVIGDAVIGDAVIGDAISGDAFSPGSKGGLEAALRGALVVTGTVEVAGPASLTGHLACHRLLVRASLSVAVPPDWRQHPPLGSAQPRLLARQ